MGLSPFVTAATACSAASAPLSTAVTPSSPSTQLPTPKTGFPLERANAISASVPQAPPIATTASAARATRPLRISPRPVGRLTSRWAFASERSSPGRMPTVVPPACFAPRDAASITPPRPPVTTVAPSSASRRPADSACSSCSAVAELAPITATYSCASAKFGSEPVTPARVLGLPAELLLCLCVRDRLQLRGEAHHRARHQLRDEHRDAERLLCAGQAPEIRSPLLHRRR